VPSAIIMRLAIREGSWRPDGAAQDRSRPHLLAGTIAMALLSPWGSPSGMCLNRSVAIRSAKTGLGKVSYWLSSFMHVRVVRGKMWWEDLVSHARTGQRKGVPEELGCSGTCSLDAVLVYVERGGLPLPF